MAWRTFSWRPPGNPVHRARVMMRPYRLMMRVAVMWGMVVGAAAGEMDAAKRWLES